MLSMRGLWPVALSIVVLSWDLAGFAQEKAGSVRGRVRGNNPRVYGARVVPHWLVGNIRFWYRHDLRGGDYEFVLVDAEQGLRQRAFDHESVARQIGAGVEPLRLPVTQLRFSDDGKALTLLGDEKAWRLDLTTGSLSETSRETTAGADGALRPEAEPRPSARTGSESEIVFENRLDQGVEVFWMDDGGRRQSYGRLGPRGRKVQHTFAGHVWLVADLTGRTLAVFEAADRPSLAIVDGRAPEPREARARRPRDREVNPGRSPDGKWTALVQDGHVVLRDADGQETRLSADGGSSPSYGRLTWSPDSGGLVAWRITPGDRKEVHLVRSSPDGGGRAQLESRPYALPGDAFSKYELNLFDIANRTQTKPAVDLFEHDWLAPELHWNRRGGGFTYAQVDRGHQRLRVIEVNPRSGTVRNIIDERSPTFIWTVHTEDLQLQLLNWLENSDEIIYVSEQTGWRHLYLVDIASGRIRNAITEGPWVVRGIERIDEAKRQVWFSAGGRNAGQDPYFLHHYRVNFDGSGLVALTEANGNHTIEFSPDRRYLIDTWSRPEAAPVHELRRTSDGALVCKLETADISELLESGWRAPEPFVAKGRDAVTDIYGLIHRPRRFDAGQKYPVIESIYAGPQGSFVPKSFSAGARFESLTELGFIVVQIDGMGTANRSKAFHDVCCRNLKDGGFLDRILWMKAAAERYPSMDLTRVGIYGNSAGGQNAAAAVLFHPEFYKAAVASCGCHDNRMDKASWNEQWMGYLPADKIWQAEPGNWYSQCSNIDNAWRLQGHLFLIVGEMDNNVPPESTLRLANALVRAGKDFELLVIPNGGHGMGGAYGDRRMRDFFARHLLGIEPPNRNAESKSGQ